MAVAFTRPPGMRKATPVRNPGSSSYLAAFAPAAPFGVVMAAEAAGQRVIRT
jgi:hypothetical protein